MNGKILLTGATGFTGRFVCLELLKRNVEFTCLVRPESNTFWLDKQSIPYVYGNLEDIVSIELAFSGFSTLINVASLGFGYTGNIIRACHTQNIQRAVFVSTTAIFTQLNASSKSIRIAAELTIRDSGINYTILRPTMIYGTPADRNMVKLIRFLSWSPIIPIFGRGCSKQQPVHVADIAWAICEVLNHSTTIGNEYNLSGGQILTYNQVIEVVASYLGRNPFKLYIPHKPIVQFLNLLHSLRIPTPIKGEQVLRLNENKTFDYSHATVDFGYTPRSFSVGIASEIELFLKADIPQVDKKNIWGG
ncbi:MAG: NAD-dependent epimerase/dehydratase family protein [Synechococcales bacterium]|nr:NAD(P)H-binding protein [Cyanobacteria bacterium REEB444]MEB3126037.1 NAD-dependent epimerase/dehydratase family protein [Synechococcales bacterium]